jgi:hypothetical protein
VGLSDNPKITYPNLADVNFNPYRVLLNERKLRDEVFFTPLNESRFAMKSRCNFYENGSNRSFQHNISGEDVNQKHGFSSTSDLAMHCLSSWLGTYSPVGN